MEKNYNKKMYMTDVIKFSKDIEEQNDKFIDGLDDLSASVDKMLYPNKDKEKALKFLKENSSKEFPFNHMKTIKNPFEMRELLKNFNFYMNAKESSRMAGFTDEKTEALCDWVASERDGHWYRSAYSGDIQLEKESIAKEVPLALWDDKKFVLEAVKINGTCLKFAGLDKDKKVDLRKDLDCWIEAVKNITQTYGKENAKSIIMELWYKTQDTRLPVPPAKDLALEIFKSTGNDALIEERLQVLDETQEKLMDRLDLIKSSEMKDAMSKNSLNKRVEQLDKEHVEIIEKMREIESLKKQKIKLKHEASLNV